MAEKKLMVVVGGRTSEFEKAMKGVQKKMNAVSRDMVKIGKGMTTAITLPIAAVGGASIKAFGDFQQTMAQSTAIMGDLSQEMRGSMETAAREIGTTTRFSATEAAQAFEFLALAGLDAEQSMAALPQVAAFAQAGNFDLARATDLATDAQAALGMTATDASKNLTNLTRVTDTLTRAATLANANTEQFSEALTEKAGVAMRNLQIDIEQGTAALAVFADQGVKGGQAGTTLNATLEGLSRQAIINKDKFKAYNVEVFDSEGKMKNLADITTDLEKALGSMSTEEQRATLMKLGFNRQALNGIQMLMGNSAAIREYESELRSAAGTTGDVAEKQLDNFYDKMGLIKSRVVDAAIELGSKLVPVLEDVFLPMLEKLAGALGRAAEWFGNLSPGMQKFIIIAAGIAAAIGPILIVVGKLIGAISAIIPVVTGIAGFLGPVFAAIAGGISAIGAPVIIVAGLIIAAIVLIAKNWDSIVELLKIGWEWISGVFIKGWEAVSGFFGNLWEGIKNIFSATWEWIKDMFLRFHPIGLIISHWDTISEFFVNLWAKVKDGFKKGWDGIVNAIRGPVNVILGFANGIINAFENMLNAVGGAINRIPKFKIPDWVPVIGGGEFGLPKIPTAKFPRIPLMDTGGLVRGPGVFQVGAGVTEVVRRYNPSQGGGEMRHTGTITVRGVNDQGQLAGVVDVVIERLLAEVRT